jgi:hypothetical protein
MGLLPASPRGPCKPRRAPWPATAAFDALEATPRRRVRRGDAGPWLPTNDQIQRLRCVLASLSEAQSTAHANDELRAAPSVARRVQVLPPHGEPAAWRVFLRLDSQQQREREQKLPLLRVQAQLCGAARYGRGEV